MSNTSSIGMDFIGETVGTALDRKEQALRATLEGISDDPTPKEMTMMMKETTEWTTFVSLQSTMIKEVGDAVKGVIQKAS